MAVLDNFNRTEDPLSQGGNWSTLQNNGPLKADGTKCLRGTTGFTYGFMAYTGIAAATVPVQVAVTLKAITPGDHVFIGWVDSPGSSAFQDGYYVALVFGTSILLRKRVGGPVDTDIATMADPGLAVNDVIGLEITSSGVFVYRNGVQILNSNDTSNSGVSGYRCLAISGTVNAVDDFSDSITIAGFTDSATEYLDLQPSGTELGPVSDAATVRLSLTPSGSEIKVYDDTGTVVIFKVGSGTDAQVFADSVTAYLDLQPSTSDIGPFGDIATEYLDLVPSGVSIGPSTDLATIPVRFTPAQEVVIAETIPFKLTPISTAEELHQCLPRFVGEIKSWLAEDIRTNWHAEVQNPRWSGELIVEAVINHTC